MIIDSRLGKREIDEKKIISFPHGIIGFEELHNFTLLRIHEDSPLLVLQSLEVATMGLLVTDPFCFISNYKPQLNDVGKSLLKTTKIEDLAILVSATIPPGKPEETSLNLLGPFIINESTRIGVQTPQTDGSNPSHASIFLQEATLK